MKRILFCSAACLAACAAFGAMRPTPEYLKSAVVYQMVLRNFTRDGNFKAATEMLEHVRSAGVDVVYLCPFVEMDCDMDESGWSTRQKKSAYHTPKNPYRISNYDKIDPEYGHDADFKAFNEKAHALGMKVYMDLVYLHCGPNNVMKDMFPDAFQKNPDGTVRTTQWHFPFVNFESKGVRTYLIDSMLHWISLGCDGFRCDVGDAVPIDFWVEAVTACQKVKPDLVMINEGRKPEWLEKAFDACYGWPWSFSIRNFLTPALPGQKNAKNKTLAQKMRDVRDYEAKVPEGALMFVFMDNHDTAADDWENRFDRVHPVEAGNAAFVLTFLRRGLPLIFNGNEIADNSLNTFFAPVEDIARARKTVDWARALQPAGQKRLALIRALADLRHRDALFQDAPMAWVTDGEAQGAIAFTRSAGGRRAFVAANLTGKPVAFAPSGVPLDPARQPILAENGSIDAAGVHLGPWGYVVVAADAATIQMPSGCTTPDGMTIDPKGRFVIAAPNTKHDLPGAIYRIDAPGAAPVKWFEVPPLKESGYAQPMGVCFGADGEMYVCDCQKAGLGRLLRVTFKDDRPVAFETVAEGLANANGVKYRNGRLYVTQAFMPGVTRTDGASTSGLYMFSASDRHVRPANAPTDPQCVFSDVTRNPKIRGGLNGVAIDSRGVLYTGNYGDGHVWKLTLGDDGRVAKSELFVPASAGVKTPDGLCVDAKDNLYIADMMGDAAVKVTPQGEVSFVKKGGFIRPSEPGAWRGRLYVANWGGTTVEEIPLGD